MKRLITYLSKKSSSLENGSGMTRKRLGNDSMKSRNYHDSILSRFCVVSLICVLLLTLGVSNAWGTTTYKLTAVTSVAKNNKYVFVEDGHALTTVSSKKLQSNGSYSSTGLAGTENYVWLLEESTNGFYLKNCNTSTYLNNSSKTDMSMGSASSEWTFSFGVSTANILNYSNSNRFIGETSDNSYEYKAYSESGHANDFTIYRLDEEASGTSVTLSKADASNGSF